MVIRCFELDTPGGLEVVVHRPHITVDRNMDLS
jgi:hypothetical protein